MLQGLQSPPESGLSQDLSIASTTVRLFTETPEKGIRDRSEKKRSKKISQESFLPLPSKQRGAHLEIRITSGDTLKGSSTLLSLLLSEPHSDTTSVLPLRAPRWAPVSVGGAPQKERGSGTSLSKAQGSRGEVSLLSTNPGPWRARESDATGVPSKQFPFIATNSWFI